MQQITLSDAEALRAIMETSARTFDTLDERDHAFQAIARRLDLDGRRRVSEALTEARAKVAERVGHDWTALEFEAALALTPPARPWIEPGSLRRAEERLHEAEAAGALRNDDTLSRLSLVAVDGDRIRRAAALIRDAADAKKAGDGAAGARLREAEHAYEALIREILASPAFRQHLAEATIERDRRLAEWKRLTAWIKRHKTETNDLFGLQGDRQTGAPQAQTEQTTTTGAKALPKPGATEQPADGAFLDDGDL